MRRLLYRIPIVNHLLWRFAAARVEREAWRRQAAEHNAAVTRILEQAQRLSGQHWPPR